MLYVCTLLLKFAFTICGIKFYNILGLLETVWGAWNLITWLGFVEFNS